MSHRLATPIPCALCPHNRRCDFVICFLRQDPPSPPPPWAMPQ